MFQAKVEEARRALWEVTEQNTEVLRSTVHLMEQRKELQIKLSSRQKDMVITTSVSFPERSVEA